MPEEKVDTGYKLKERAEPDKHSGLMKYVCDECGGTNVEDKWYCTWSVPNQRWVPSDHCNDDAYCGDCGDHMGITETPL